MSARVTLHSCAETNDTALFAELLYRRDRDVDLNFTDETGRSALKVACENGNLEIVTLLIDAQCDVNQTDMIGDSPLHTACSLNRLEIVQVLIIAGANVNAANQDGVSPAYMATVNKHTEVLRLLIGAGADVTMGDKNGATPLHMVSEHLDSTDAAHILIAAGADVNALNKYGWTPLHDAAQENNLMALSYLIQCGADVNISDMDGWTPLYIAAQNGHVQVVKALLRSGAAHVDVIDKEGNTPLIVASKYGQTAVAELLLLGGADYFIRNTHGRRARDVAAVKGLRKLFKAFDLGLAAARLYTKHHAQNAPTPAAPAIDATAYDAVLAGVASTSVESADGSGLADPSSASTQDRHQPPLSPLQLGALSSFRSTNSSPVKPAKRVRRGVLSQSSGSFRAALRSAASSASAASASAGAGPDDSFCESLDVDDFDDAGEDGIYEDYSGEGYGGGQGARRRGERTQRDDLLERAVMELQKKLDALEAQQQRSNSQDSTSAGTGTGGDHNTLSTTHTKAVTSPAGVITEVQLIFVALAIMAILYVTLNVLLYVRI